MWYGLFVVRNTLGPGIRVYLRSKIFTISYIIIISLLSISPHVIIDTAALRATTPVVELPVIRRIYSIAIIQSFLFAVNSGILY
jgi:hypothetical protein